MLDVDDLVLISVDDHLIEPLDLFVNHLDAKYQDRAPKLVRKAEGSDVWTFGDVRRQATGHDVSVVSRSTRIRTPDEKLEGFRHRARRAVAAGA